VIVNNKIPLHFSSIFQGIIHHSIIQALFICGKETRFHLLGFPFAMGAAHYPTEIGFMIHAKEARNIARIQRKISKTIAAGKLKCIPFFAELVAEKSGVPGLGIRASILLAVDGAMVISLLNHYSVCGPGISGRLCLAHRRWLAGLIGMPETRQDLYSSVGSRVLFWGRLAVNNTAAVLTGWRRWPESDEIDGPRQPVSHADKQHDQYD
jgi:hypothetical protein